MSLDIMGGCECCNRSVFSHNITHNLGNMAFEAGIYKTLWRPEELGYKFARDLIPSLEEGLKLLKSEPEGFEKYNSPNGWGKYENFVLFVEAVLESCKEYPNVRIKISR